MDTAADAAHDLCDAGSLQVLIQGRGRDQRTALPVAMRLVSRAAGLRLTGLARMWRFSEDQLGGAVERRLVGFDDHQIVAAQIQELHLRVRPAT